MKQQWLVKLKNPQVNLVFRERRGEKMLAKTQLIRFRRTLNSCHLEHLDITLILLSESMILWN